MKALRAGSLTPQQGPRILFSLYDNKLTPVFLQARARALSRALVRARKLLTFSLLGLEDEIRLWRA